MTLYNIDAKTLKQWLDEDKAKLVDVREAAEHAAERIEGAELHPLSEFDPAAISGSNGVKVVLHCRTGMRSADAAQRLLAQGHADAYHLEGGLQGWKREGLPTQSSGGRAPIGIMRQVQITAGSLVVIGVVLGFLVSPWLFGLSAFVGAGLVFAGVSGTCGMATMLAKMPWNRGLTGARAPGCDAGGCDA
jgi:rhodanese-related sulfurtransferase